MKPEKYKINVPADYVSGEVSLSDSEIVPSAASSPGGGGELIFKVSFTLILIMKALLLLPNHLPKVPFLMPLSLGVKVSGCKFLGDTNIQTIASFLLF